MFGWPAWLTSGFSGNLALEICFILSFVYLYVILFEPTKYLLHLLLLPSKKGPTRLPPKIHLHPFTILSYYAHKQTDPKKT